MPYTTRQQILMGTDKIGNIALTFNPVIGAAGAVKLGNDIKKFLKEKN